MEDRKTLDEYFNTDQNDEDFNPKRGPELIDRYETNKSLFDEWLRSGRKEDMEFALRIKVYKYASTLVFDEEFIFDPGYNDYQPYGFLRGHDKFEDDAWIERERSNCLKALTVLNESENELRKLESISKSSGISADVIKLNEHLIFIRAACYAKLENYKMSYREIKKLVKLNPANKNYIEWYKSTRTKATDSFVNAVQIFFLLEVMGTALVMMFASKFFQKHDMVFMFLFFGGIIGVLFTIYFGSAKDYFIKKNNPVPKKKVKVQKKDGGRKAPWEMTEGRGK
jgi:tetratricopeptide (TPR) repeat protein